METENGVTATGVKGLTSGEQHVREWGEFAKFSVHTTQINSHTDPGWPLPEAAGSGGGPRADLVAAGSGGGPRTGLVLAVIGCQMSQKVTADEMLGAN